MSDISIMAPQPVSRDAFRTMTEAERAWIISGLKRYVSHRLVTSALLDQVLQVDEPGAVLCPEDPAYGNEILSALVSALEARRARRHKTRSGDSVIAQVREWTPDAYRMMLALERANIDYDVILHLPDDRR